MTLLMRNRFFKAGIVTALIFLGGVAAAAAIVLPEYSAVVEGAARRATGIAQGLAKRLFQPAAYAPLASTAGAVLYSLAAMSLIYYFFEKTKAPEIVFIAIFVLSFAFEGLRVLIPLKMSRGLLNLYLTLGFRVLLFARYAGVFSLFAASVCAAGMDIQKYRNIFLILIVASLLIALPLPVDLLAWDTSLQFISAFPDMFSMIDFGLVLITAASFFIAAYSRGARGYVYVGAGAVLVFLGRNMLLNSDTWLSPLPGLLLLGLGTQLMCTRLHRIYLWL